MKRQGIDLSAFFPDEFPEQRKDPDKMTIAELFPRCPECDASTRKGSCAVCCWEPMDWAVTARRQYLKEHPEER